MAGHSLGELTALCLAGVYSFEDGFRIVNRRAVCMDKACNMNVDPGVMMAVDAPLAILRQMMAKWDDVYITNINSPHQLVAGGNTEQIKALSAELKAEGYRNNLLRVSMAFHSPIMECIHDELEAFIGGIEFNAPKIPVISNTTMEPFPERYQGNQADRYGPPGIARPLDAERPHHVDRFRDKAVRGDRTEGNPH